MMTPSDFDRLVHEMRFIVSFDDAPRRDPAVTALARHFAHRVAPDELDVFEHCQEQLSLNRSTEANAGQSLKTMPATEVQGRGRIV
jgi:hypothetical protein